MEEYLLELKNVKYSYGEIEALKDVNLKVKKGDFIALIGANGSGKTTLFKVIDGILKVKSGEIYFESKSYKYDSKSLNKLRENIGIVFQNPDIQIFCASVYEDLRYGLDNFKYSEEDIDRIINETAKLLKIEDLLDRPISDLSFGQKKKVALCGILVTKPKLVILDEPTAGLDPVGCIDFINLIIDLKEKNDITFIVSTHDLNFAVDYFNDFALMYDGKIIKRDNGKNIFSNEEFKKSRLTYPNFAKLSLELFNEVKFVNLQESKDYIVIK